MKNHAFLRLCSRIVAALALTLTLSDVVQARPPEQTAPSCMEDTCKDCPCPAAQGPNAQTDTGRECMKVDVNAPDVEWDVCCMNGKLTDIQITWKHCKYVAAPRAENAPDPTVNCSAFDFWCSDSPETFPTDTDCLESPIYYPPPCEKVITAQLTKPVSLG